MCLIAQRRFRDETPLGLFYGMPITDQKKSPGDDLNPLVGELSRAVSQTFVFETDRAGVKADLLGGFHRLESERLVGLAVANLISEKSIEKITLRQLIKYREHS